MNFNVRVYKDGSKIQAKVCGMTFRQFLALLMIILATCLLMLNSFMLHINEVLYNIPILLLLFVGLFMTLFKLKGLTGDKYFKLKWKYITTPKVRTYQTERVLKYEHKEFIQSKKVKETDPFI
ncbi:MULTISPECIES: PrgI family protein [Lactococcus]|uniref:PrgI family protein n=1 Tax=Lactococcus lactis TaxID=1358 RepID=A0A443L8G7_9LACT|nr:MULTISPECIES: PrgI family protein [Lactococcus]KAF6606765.1 PrgI family protein [Lactococcus sp. EKM201L]KAF6610909.1 PrgI family protein [Lactococcus sp. EKM203L]KAF6640048.1 PrgI family protein [Lactococcus sp. EKM501L]KAF6641968.1 PrgI family protein [Lactococcus sp. EKM502L]KAF6650645.1 PrgI family protein [Lactococcus sp. EKM101L]